MTEKFKEILELTCSSRERLERELEPQLKVTENKETSHNHEGILIRIGINIIWFICYETPVHLLYLLSKLILHLEFVWNNLFSWN